MDNGFALLTLEQIEKMIEAVTEKVIRKMKEEGKQKELLSYREAAALLDIKPTTISAHVRKGRFKSYMVCGKMYIKRSEIYEAVK
jgi:excisionase family DNA binding protein